VRRPDSPALLALILTVYLLLGFSTALTRSPWQDEAWFGSPAWNLASHGFMGTTVLDPASSTWKSVRLTGIDRRTYWVMPLSLLLNSVSFRIFGFGSLPMRLPSLLFGILFLLAWRAILRRLDAPPGVTVLALLLIAVDYHFQSQAADGRMDAMTAALGYSAIAAYLVLRPISLTRAVAVSHMLGAAAFFTHPNGALPVLLLVVTTVTLDARRLAPKLLIPAAAPYLLLAAAWGVYILQSPSDFMTQFFGNAAGRGPTITTPWAAVKLEITNRYFNNFGLAPWTSTSGRLNLIPLLVLLAGVAICLAVREIRTHPGYRLILVWTGITVVYLTWFEGLKTQFYLIYLTPLYSVLCATAAAWLWTKRRRVRVPVAVAIAVLALLQATRTLAIAARRPRQTAFEPAAAFLRSHYTPATLIFGNGSLLFGLGPEWRVLDDFRLGYNSGKRAAAIVIDDSWQDRQAVLATEHPEIGAHVQRTIGSYREIYNHNGYRILAQ
jgi:hypothetical protein